jgi:hypothetical protein
MNKLLTFPLRNSLGDCTNDGLSSKVTHAYLVWDVDPIDQDQLLEDFYQEKGEDFFVVVFVIKELVPFGKHGMIAVPYTIYKSGRHSMFGGNFLYTSDSRFPSDAPIAIHDRIED